MTQWTAFRALNHRDFRLYAIGQSISLVGTWMQGVAQSWLIYRLTHSEWMLGLTLFAAHFPQLVLGPVAGVVADRFPRHRIVLTTQTLAFLQAILLAYLTYTGQVTTGIVWILATLLGCFNAFDIPARQTLFIQMVGRQDLISAISLNSAIFNSSRIIGPALAGIVVAAVGEAVCFSINALTYTAMIACLLLMRLPAPGTHARPGGTLLSGFQYLTRHREVAILIGMSGLLNLGYAPVLALGPFFADGIFQMGSTGLGFFGGAMGAGASVGVLRLARHQGISGLPHVMSWSAMVMAVALTAFAWSQWFSFSLMAMVWIGFALVRQNASGNSLIQTVVPDEYRGRMMALYTMLVMGMLPIGTLTSGLLAARFGPRLVVTFTAVVCLAGAIAFRAILPRLQEWVNRQEQVCAA